MLLNRDEKLTGIDSVLVKLIMSQCLMSLNELKIGQLWPTVAGPFPLPLY